MVIVGYARVSSRDQNLDVELVNRFVANQNN
jgi:DNA invertase Pin-like site-specific DNA recombinase